METGLAVDPRVEWVLDLLLVLAVLGLPCFLSCFWWAGWTKSRRAIELLVAIGLFPQLLNIAVIIALFTSMSNLRLEAVVIGALLAPVSLLTLLIALILAWRQRKQGTETHTGRTRHQLAAGCALLASISLCVDVILFWNAL